MQKNSNVNIAPSTTHEDEMNFVFANSSEDDAIYPLTVPEIANAQKDDKTLSKLHNKKDYDIGQGPTYLKVHLRVLNSMPFG